MLCAKYMGMLLVCYFSGNSEGFGIPDPLDFEHAMAKLKDMDRMNTVYLDFDKTLTVNGYSEVVRNGYCQQKYPKCPPFDENDDMALVTTIKEGKKIDGDTLFNVSNADNKELIESFGGKDRLGNITLFLGNLREANASVKIVSTSWFPITEKQWQEYLYYITQQFELGFEKNEILTVLDPGVGKSADKGAKIQSDAGIEDGNFLYQAIFADDSWGNIKSSRNICYTLYLRKREGLDLQDRDYILSSVKPR